LFVERILAEIVDPNPKGALLIQNLEYIRLTKGKSNTLLCTGLLIEVQSIYYTIEFCSFPYFFWRQLQAVRVQKGRIEQA
jgi:hypothetical protein